MEVVLDASFALAWVRRGEGEGKADRFLDRISARDVLWIPAIWWYEIANALTVAERKRRITEADVTRAIGLFERLPLRTDIPERAAAALRYFALARQHGLSAYDAAYLELAERQGLALATLDRRLHSAAIAAGIPAAAD